MLQELKFEKIKKKYALKNSYFKNCNPTNPSNPSEVLAYYKEHNELPYKAEITEDWFYECFCEYQKRYGVYNSQFFTPIKTANRIAKIVANHSYPSTRILDACCGFGQITKALQNRGYNQIEAFDNSLEMLRAYCFWTGIDASLFDFHNEEQFANKYDLIVANPPYEVKELTRFLEFVNNHLNEGGRSVLLIPKGFLDKQRPANLVKILNDFEIESREDMSEKFERTNVNAEIVILSK